MLPAGFEHKNPVRQRPQNHALDHAATGDRLKELNVINLVNLLIIFVKILIALPFRQSFLVIKLLSKYTEHFSTVVGINGYTEVVERQSMRSFACIPLMSCTRWFKNRNKQVGMNDTDKVGYDDRFLNELLF
jgi:hypothetical protein